MAKLTEAQKDALLWCYPIGRRRWFTPIGGDPHMSALMALVRKGLANKHGGDGFNTHIVLTDAGLAERKALFETLGASQ